MDKKNSNVTILVIEDEIAIAEGLVDLLEFQGYRVKHCPHGTPKARY